MVTGPWQYQRGNPYLNGYWTVIISTYQSISVWLLDCHNINGSIQRNVVIGPSQYERLSPYMYSYWSVWRNLPSDNIFGVNHLKITFKIFRRNMNPFCDWCVVIRNFQVVLNYYVVETGNQNRTWKKRIIFESLKLLSEKNHLNITFEMEYPDKEKLHVFKLYIIKQIHFSKH